LYLRSITGRDQDITDVALEVLRACQEKNILTELLINTMSLVNSAGKYRFVECLRGLTNLREISFVCSDITDDLLLSMVEAIREYTLFEKLNLNYNRIGNAGCEALATLRNVNWVHIADNNIGNEGMIAFANSLSENNHLRGLIISNNLFDIQSVADDFCKSLCNTSSINDIYSSNHTLETIRTGLGPNPNPNLDEGARLVSLLKLNRSTKNKKHVAIKKILLCHSHGIDMEPLFDLSLEDDDCGQDLRALPYVMAWFETAREAIGHSTRENEYDSCSNNDSDPPGEESIVLEGRWLSAIYHFVTSMPMLFVPASHMDKGADKKRKRR